MQYMLYRGQLHYLQTHAWMNCAITIIIKLPSNLWSHPALSSAGRSSWERMNIRFFHSIASRLFLIGLLRVARARQGWQIQYCYSNFSSIEDNEKCPNRGVFKRKIKAIEEMLWFSAPSKTVFLDWSRRTADIPNQTNYSKKQKRFLR
jgi:hypothetical protein